VKYARQGDMIAWMEEWRMRSQQPGLSGMSLLCTLQ
jgi:hypothetical protein